MIDESIVIFSKVSLGDIFVINSRDYKEKMTCWNKINRKHVDFLICNRETLQPVVGMELDDSTHQRQDRQLRDQFVNQVFKSAKLPLIHMKVKQAYTNSDLQENLKGYIKQNLNVIKVGSRIKISIPVCPKCHIEMVARETKKVKQVGQKFYGGINYPRCRQI